jgi:hypothetical protein
MNILKSNKQFSFKRDTGALVIPLLTLIIVLIFNGCASVPDEMRDDRTIPQLIEHLKKSGLKINKTKNVRYQALLASDGKVMVVEGANVEFYLYDMKEDYQRKKLEKIKKHGYIMVLGYKIPAITNGKFIMLTYSENPNKIKVIRAFRDFKLN